MTQDGGGTTVGDFAALLIGITPGEQAPHRTGSHGGEVFRYLLFVPVNAETPPMWGGVSGAAGEPDDYLLSHGNPHYHRRGVVSRSCSGWEGVGPTRYGHQA